MSSKQFGSLSHVQPQDLLEVARLCCQWLMERNHRVEVPAVTALTADEFRALFKDVLMTPTEFECWKRRVVCWNILPKIDRVKVDFDMYAMRCIANYDPDVYFEVMRGHRHR